MSATESIVDATARYETWLSKQLSTVGADLKTKHAEMAQSPFMFLRATFYRWVQLYPAICPEEFASPDVLAVGDLHLDNFGTWRDAEGRLIWGINDFDEASNIPYTYDLVRLATSALLDADAKGISGSAGEICANILDGYAQAIQSGGEPFVLEEEHAWLREFASDSIREPSAFWEKLESKTVANVAVPPEVKEMLQKELPERGTAVKIAHRTAGLGSLGRRRFVAIGTWKGGLFAREAKELCASACHWEKPASGEINYDKIVGSSVRALDPFVHMRSGWIIRRLSPDCTRIDVSALPRKKDDLKLLKAMGKETANIHLGSAARLAQVRSDLKKRKASWLQSAAEKMHKAVSDDWKEWKKDGPKK